MRLASIGLFALIWQAGCGTSTAGDPDGGSQAACVENGAAICQKACDCNSTDECSQVYPGSGSGQTFNSDSQCRSAWRDYCGDLSEGLIDPQACAADLADAACVDHFGDQAVRIPDSCYRYLSTPECMDYGQTICDLACACDLGEVCPVGLSEVVRQPYGSWSECNSNMVGSCDQGTTGVEDYPACLADLDGAECVDILGSPGLLLPGSCWVF